MGGSRAKLCEQFSLWTRWGRRAVLGLTASLRLLTGYLTGWNSKTTHVYAPPYGFTPPTPPKRQQFSFWGRCRINAPFRQVWERRIYVAARRQSENCRAPKAKMRIAAWEFTAVAGNHAKV